MIGRSTQTHQDDNDPAMIYTADHLDDARAVFIFRPRYSLDFAHRDVPRRRRQLLDAFTGMAADVDRLLCKRLARLRVPSNTVPILWCSIKRRE
jgi:hypothetical protein